MLSIYPAIFHEECCGYSVIFPDLEYLSTCGETLEEAIEMAIDCLAGHLYWLQLDGKIAPEPSSTKNINIHAIGKTLELNFDADNTFINMISVDVKEYAKIHFEKAVKKTLTIPAWLNKLAMEQNINFSQVLQKALLDILEIPVNARKKGV